MCKKLGGIDYMDFIENQLKTTNKQLKSRFDVEKLIELGVFDFLLFVAVVTAHHAMQFVCYIEERAHRLVVRDADRVGASNHVLKCVG